MEIIYDNITASIESLRQLESIATSASAVWQDDNTTPEATEVRDLVQYALDDLVADARVAAATLISDYSMLTAALEGDAEAFAKWRAGREHRRQMARCGNGCDIVRLPGGTVERWS